MKNINKKIIILMMICLCMLCTACDSSLGEEILEEQEILMAERMVNTTTELNDRQKKIMEKEGLPQDYDKLTDRQKEAAIKADMLLTYLEDKYNKEFAYISYMETYEGSLAARALDDGRCRHILASLEWNGKEYTYKDTYSRDVLAADDYENLFDEFMMENYPEIDYFLDVGVCDMDEGEKITTDNACVALTMVIDDCYEDKIDYKDFLTTATKWMENSKYNNRIFCVVMEHEDFETANYFNYLRYLHEDKYKYVFNSRITADGEFTFKERQ